VTIAEIVAQRDIREVLHYTTNDNLIGIITRGMLRPRARLTQDEYVKHVVMMNCPTRYDCDHLDYVSLSISRVAPLINISTTRWHGAKDVWWCVLSFDPEILSHPGVIFTTTNNKWHKSVSQSCERPAQRGSKGCSPTASCTGSIRRFRRSVPKTIRPIFQPAKMRKCCTPVISVSIT
jgi:hypothetical protein